MGRREKRLARFRRKIGKRWGHAVQLEVRDDVLFLTGLVPEWLAKVALGHGAGKLGFRGVVNDIQVSGVSEPSMSLPLENDNSLEGKRYDVVIIGGGIIGCAVARELSRKNLKIGVLEKESDLAMQASGRNDGMIHPGFAPHPGTRKAHYNVRGNQMYDQWSQELGFSLKRPGSIVLFRSWFSIFLVPLIRLRCSLNGVAGKYKYLSPRAVRAMEPHVSAQQRGGFFLPSAGIVSPFDVTLALAENAVENGVDFHLETAVMAMEMSHQQIQGLQTNRGCIEAKVVVNAAGVWADVVAQMADDRFFSLHGRKGTDAILDKETGARQTRIMAMPPLVRRKSIQTKGGGIVPCVEGNLLLGPTAQEVPDREDYSTDAGEFSHLVRQLDLNSRLSASQIINYYSGVRAASWDEDFIIEPSQKVKNLVHAAAIQSPGLASAPAIGADVAAMAVQALERCGYGVEERENFQPYHHAQVPVKDLPEEERSALIAKDSTYGEILCRCEEVSRGEVRDALRSLVPALTVDGVKRRTRSGAGRCHGGFCLSRVMKVMAEEMGVPLTQIRKKDGQSQILVGETKGGVSPSGRAS
ncbi:MAG: FAD-dependent oxidoreductase [Spirochaetales bacterium]|nr:FAD-dependent oxidoreductase [Spirochaetales bacterium]